MKRRLFADVEKVVGPACVLATNTSSLSVTALAAGLARPERLVGMHFFNPVPLMRLVEIVSGLATAPETAERAAALARNWGKTVVGSTDTPGFIVNRIARPFYAEAWRLAEEHAATPAVIDAVLTGAGGFRMGPFALMDLIGHDVNEAVTSSVWAAFGHDPRFAPSLAQRALVQAGWLGPQGRPRLLRLRRRRRAAGPRPPLRPSPPRTRSSTGARNRCGRCSPAPGSPPSPSRAAPPRPCGPAAWPSCQAAPCSPAAPAPPPPPCRPPPTARSSSSTGHSMTPPRPPSRSRRATAARGPTSPPRPGCSRPRGWPSTRSTTPPGLIVTRTVAMLANLAADAVARQVASAADIDTAMRLGTNYPVGPIAWSDPVGRPGHPRHPGRPGELVPRHPLPGRPRPPPRGAELALCCLRGDDPPCTPRSREGSRPPRSPPAGGARKARHPPRPAGVKARWLRW